MKTAGPLFSIICIKPKLSSPFLLLWVSEANGRKNSFVLWGFDFGENASRLCRCCSGAFRSSRLGSGLLPNAPQEACSFQSVPLSSEIGTFQHLDLFCCLRHEPPPQMVQLNLGGLLTRDYTAEIGKADFSLKGQNLSFPFLSKKMFFLEF